MKLTNQQRDTAIKNLHKTVGIQSEAIKTLGQHLMLVQEFLGKPLNDFIKTKINAATAAAAAEEPSAAAKAAAKAQEGGNNGQE